MGKTVALSEAKARLSEIMKEVVEMLEVVLFRVAALHWGVMKSNIGVNPIITHKVENFLSPRGGRNFGLCKILIVAKMPKTYF